MKPSESNQILSVYRKDAAAMGSSALIVKLAH